MKMFKTILKVLLIPIALFGVTFGVYMFNLDMKLLAFLEPYLDKIYDKRKREPKV